jgi:hypothetical protein
MNQGNQEKEGLIIGIGMDPKAEGMNELCVPLASLSLQDDEGTQPAQGDMVDFSVAGTVSRIEGDKAYVTIKKVNGEDLSNEESEEGEAEENQEEAKLRSAAKEVDKEMEY